MFDNSRDAFGIAQYLLGYDVNTTDRSELEACAAKLEEQKPVVQQYVMDQVYSLMENEEAYIAVYYAGDCMSIMCIPTCCQEKDAAELFINFLCDPEISGANMDYIYYGSPISEARNYMDPELAESPVAYPDEEILVNGTSYAFLPEDISRYVEGLFMKLRNS